jgi:DNA-binding MarR family transcriptional regulator
MTPNSLSRLRPRPDTDDYRTLSEFRYLVRRFLEFSQTAAQAVGLTSRQHQALLAIKGFPRDHPVTVGDLAERLWIQHHSAVELVDRLVGAGLIERMHDAVDRRQVLLSLTAAAEEHLASLSAAHLEELRRLRSTLLEILARVGGR